MERLTWQQIKEKYPHQWIGMVNVEWESEYRTNVKEANVKYIEKQEMN